MKLELVVDRIEEDRVVLMDQDQNIFVWPKKVFDNTLREGQMMLVAVGDSPQRLTQESKDTAKDILNEILRLDE